LTHKLQRKRGGGARVNGSVAGLFSPRVWGILPFEEYNPVGRQGRSGGVSHISPEAWRNKPLRRMEGCEANSSKLKRFSKRKKSELRR